MCPYIETFELTADGVSSDSFRASLTGEDLEIIEKIGWTAEQGVPVGLPLPTGNGQKQQLQARFAPAREPDAALFLWLRNETKPRVTTVRPGLALHRLIGYSA